MALPMRAQVDERAESAPVAEVARALRGVLGADVTAVIAGTTETDAIDRWAAGQESPAPAVTRRLRDALRVVDLLLEVDDPTVVRAWFIGMNPELDDRAAALVIAEEPEEVMLAARVFYVEG